MEKAIRDVRSAIEDLAFTIRSSRESDKVGRRCCIEHDFAKALEIRASTGTEDRVEEFGCKCAQFIAAEKGDEGMALKILTREEDMPDGKDILEIHAHTKWKRTILKNCRFHFSLKKY